jgi:adenylate cyclase
VFDALPAVVQTRCGTVLFADLRGYVNLAEKLGPAQVVPLLEELLAVLSGAVELFGGEVFHMAGDGMMAGFGFQDPSGDGAGEALAASRSMLEGFMPLAKRWHKDLSIQTGMGVGLHFGEVALAFLGPPGRQAETLVGDTVNVAARLCSRARAGEVLLSASVAARLEKIPPRGSLSDSDGGPVPFLRLPMVELRGRAERVDIWCVPARERLQVLAV